MPPDGQDAIIATDDDRTFAKACGCPFVMPEPRRTGQEIVAFRCVTCSAAWIEKSF
jgi:hypothetical protein